MGKLSNLEFFKKVAETGEAPADGSRFIYPPAIAKTLGFRLIEVGPGTATMELMADTEIHANPMGRSMAECCATLLMRPSGRPMPAG
jgi:acyl-coenzyme A thioesterase PaaI-like protein